MFPACPLNRNFSHTRIRALPDVSFSHALIIESILVSKQIRFAEVSNTVRMDGPQVQAVLRLSLETLAVYNGGTALIVLLLGDPHLLECRQRSQDGTTNPNGVFALWGGNYLDFHR